ncbi:hypothetical protein [Frankia sp. AgPm24]|uniref:hypothetical protein n=1 Tax=Frankia sp. AgPm24 TaxID=631128 RepID=UPI00200FD743|nr:hypothetical protein [Frankia sp. AgPm24]
MANNQDDYDDRGRIFRTGWQKPRPPRRGNTPPWLVIVLLVAFVLVAVLITRGCSNSDSSEAADAAPATVIVTQTVPVPATPGEATDL